MLKSYEILVKSIDNQNKDHKQMVKLNEFKKSLAFTLKWEGTYSNDKDDPGGETKWGISKRAYPNLDILNLTPEQAASIYANDYWDKAGCDQIPFPFCTAVFDSAVNLGVGRVLGWLKEAKDVKAFLDKRRRFYYDRVNKSPTSVKYLKGWLNRLNDLSKFVDTNTNPVGEDRKDVNS